MATIQVRTVYLQHAEGLCTVAFRNVRIEPFDILGKMCHAQMVFTRTHLVPQAISAAQQLVGIAHDLELFIDIFQPARTVQMIFFAALH